MGKKTKETEDTANVPAKKLELVPVSIDITQEVDELADLPEELLKGAEIYDSALPPSPTWEKPGEYLEGVYLGQKDHVGPNAQILYSFKVQFKGESKEVAVWGSTNLDDRMRLANPQHGDHVVIIFKGETETARKQSPLKLFTVIVRRKK